MDPSAQYDLVVATDLHILIRDRDQGRSVTNDADNVVRRIDDQLGGIGKRRLFYRDTMGRFDELIVRDGRFLGFAPCSIQQQAIFRDWCNAT
jgi:hypothetical protein